MTETTYPEPRRFKAVGSVVYVRPRRSSGGTTMGFRLLDVASVVSDAPAIAAELAELLNRHWSDWTPESGGGASDGGAA